MKITVCKTEQEFDLNVAHKIVAQIVRKPDSVLGLATGNTTENIHRTVAKIYREYPFDISLARWCALDEVVMVSADSDVTCIMQLKSDLFDPCGIPAEHYVLPATLADDYDREALDFARRVDALGEIDLQILGIGPDGHIAMNLPGSPFDSPTRFTALSGELHGRILKEGGFPSDKELGGITLGMKPIMNMKNLILAAKGTHKAEIIAKAVNGPVTEDVPASLLQLHPNVEFILDADAAEAL